MRSAIITAAFALGALAVPYQKAKKRDMVTNIEYDVVYTTVIVTETAGAAALPSPQNKHGDSRHHHYGGFHGSNPSAPKPPANDPAPAPSDPSPEPQPQPQPQPEPKPAPEPTSLKTDLLPTPTNLPTPPLGGGNGGGSGGGSGSAGSSYSDIAVFHHNIHRRNHSAPEISWDAGLQKSAADIAATCIYEHNTEIDGGGYGQNIAAGVEPNNISAIITNLFYNGEVNYYEGLYGQANPSMANFEQWGHFSQIVWKSTTHFACATQDCSGQGLANVGGDVAPYFTVCNYKSPGNFGGEYGQNVGEPLGQPTANWNTGM